MAEYFELMFMTNGINSLLLTRLSKLEYNNDKSNDNSSLPIDAVPPPPTINPSQSYIPTNALFTALSQVLIYQTVIDIHNHNHSNDDG